jgi:small-conductance mechanosensitive channel
MSDLRARHLPSYLPLIWALALTLLWLGAASPVLGADAVPSGARQALAPVTRMIGTLVAIAIGLGIAICTAVIVWGGIEKMLAGANSETEHRAQRRISNGIMGLVWMVVASVVVSVITAIAVAYGLIEKPF